MQVIRTDISPTKLSLKITAGAEELVPIKDHTLSHFAGKVKVPGFREGAAPSGMLEKHVDQKALVDEFLEHALNSLYTRAVVQENVRPVAPPRVEIKKMVPFTDLEFDAEVDVLGPIKLPDYKKIKLAKPSVKVEPAEVEEVLKSLVQQQAERKEVQRAAKNGDEIVLDFKGTDTEGNPIAGADGRDYPLLLGSKTFIPGFEENLIGLKPGAEKTFELSFPKDYGVKNLQSKKVTFAVTAKKVNEVKQPAIDDKFAAKAGPFKTLADLKADIKKQLEAAKERDSLANYQNELVDKIVEKSELEVPASLVEEQLMRAEEEEKRNLVFRGQTWEEHLVQEGITESEHRERQRPSAEQSVKTGLVLGEIAEREDIKITPEELSVWLQLLKDQYTDPKMQAELDKPDNQRDIEGRLRLEKTINQLTNYATKS